MPFTELRTRLATLPKILAGPILRRVEARSVTVWFASRVAFTQVSLQLLGPGGTAQIATGTGQTNKVGENLHIGLITATIPNASAPLTPGNTYFYSMSFDGSALASPGMISASGGSDALLKISYPGAGALPSFSLPPNQIDKVCILHGSCRKPHAESLDAMQIADHLIRQNAADPLARPHQLFLTGDQIYADDVAIAMLAVLTDVGNTLLNFSVSSGQMGTTEVVPGLPADAGPDARQQLAIDELGFTSTEAGSHLFTFAEFCAMYLMTWSDVLWPTDLPGFKDLFPAEEETHGVHILGLDLFESDTARNAKFKRERAWLNSFKASLPRVRRALANVPTYMIADDHEITDDWYMNRDWAEAVFAKPAGLRVIQNGLAAFLLFQGSGNDPAYYLSQQAFNGFVTAIGNWVTGGFQTGAALDSIGAALPIPTGPLGSSEVIRADRPLRFHFAIGWGAHRVLALDTRTWRRYPKNNPIDAVLLSGPGLDFQFTDFASLLAQAPALASDGIYLVIAPSPVLDIPYVDAIVEDGVAFVDFFKKLFTSATDSSIALDRDREILKLSAPAYDGMLNRVTGLANDAVAVVLLSGDVHFGFAGRLEHWQPNAATTRKGFAQLTSSALKNQSSEGGLFNLETTTHVHHSGFHPLFASDDIPDPILRLTWQMTAAEETAPERRLRIGDAKILGTINVGGSYAKKDNNLAVVRSVDESITFYESVTVTRQPDLITRTTMIASSSTVTRPSTPREIETPDGTTQGKLQNHLDAAFDHHDVFFKADGPGQQAVGVNNIGRVTFQLAPANVVQELWWWLAEAKELLQAQANDDPNQPLTGTLAPQPYSRQIVPLSIADPPPLTVLK